MKISFYCGRENGPMRSVPGNWAEPEECTAKGVVEVDPVAYDYDGTTPLSEWPDSGFSMTCPRCGDDIEPGLGCFTEAPDDAEPTHRDVDGVWERITRPNAA